MKTYEMRFNSEMIKDLIGEKFVQYKCDEFDFTNSVTQIVGLYIGSKIYSLTNIQETIDYFGNNDNVAIYKFKETREKDVKSAFKDTDMIVTPVNGTIDKILLINENQKILKGNDILYDAWLTRDIIFFVNGREISFEKDIVPFSEEIIIRRGYDLMSKLPSEKEFLSSWGEDIIPKCTRQIVDFSK